ncbi:type IV pilin [Halovenus rubra]|uniref:Type IV pilin n=2 Tax=Halovenus rubra TaxID=869890 RepID=A0ABD5X8Z5_9EURY|nr:type IV pilin [Halovenus rubra]
MRGQSHVVGFVLILGFGVIALGTLTVGVGTVIDSQSSNADGARVAGDLSEAVGVVDRTGVYTDRVSFTEGSLTTVERSLRVFIDGTLAHEIGVDALRFERDKRTVTAVGGAVVHGAGASAWLESKPPITSSESNEVLVIGAPVLGAGYTTVGGQGGVTVTLQSNISHSRTSLGRGNFSVAIETQTPGPLERYFETLNATTTRRTFSGDEHGSVVATFPLERTGYLVVHDLALEVNDG